MAPRRTSSKDRIEESAIWLVANEGLQAATIRAIADRARITEGAIYRHFASKQELLASIYESLVERMAEAKLAVARSGAPFSDKLSEWVRVTYAHYDEYPDAFTFCLLTPHNIGTDLYHRQGGIFLDIVRRAQESGEARPGEPMLALSHFTGVMMNIPRLINEGVLQGPASQYAAEVSSAAQRVLLARPLPEA